jgi:glycosyltransferase involved in cell wall biosynthesis
VESTLPLVTIGVPNYNYAHFIEEALDGVAAQTYKNIELIIVDDCSTDDSIAVIENWIKRYSGSITINFIKNHDNLGLTKSCNVILKNARGKYFQPLDADDIIMPNKIEKQVNLLEANEDTALVYSNVFVINENGVITNPDYCNRIGYDKLNMPDGDIFNNLIDFNFISLPSVLINTECVRNEGGFDETLRVQDYFMWLRLAKKYTIRYMPDNLAYYRVHDASMSNKITTYLASADSVLQLKYRYYALIDSQQRKRMAKNIQNASVHLYQYKYSTYKKWISIAFYLNPGFKTCLYFLSVRLGIPFSFFNKLKTFIKPPFKS